MNFELDAEHQALRAAIRQLAQREIAPRAAELDETKRFPEENLRALADHGYLGLTVPEAYGGPGLDMLANAIVLEEVARACAATAAILDVQNSLAAEPIIRYGTEEQKKRYLPRLVTGELLGAFSLTEPQAGSEAYNLQTSAVREKGGYRLSGRKTLCTNASRADLYVVFARTDPGPGPRGISAFVVEKGTPGLGFGRPEDKMGIRASVTADVILENVRVPEDQRLGAEGEGYKIALSTLDAGRIGIGAQALGIAEAAFNLARDYARQRVQFGKPIAEHQAIRFKLAEMATDIEAARLLLWRAAWLWHRPGRHSKEIAMAKLVCSTVAMRRTIDAVQIHGGYGYLRDYTVERLMRDAKITELYEGTSEVMRLIIGNFVLEE